jgi:hypothetical protein
VAAAKLIHSQIRETDHSTTNYPNTGDFDNIKTAIKWVPNLLNTFMERVIGGEMKRVAISRAIVQAEKSRSAISPLLFVCWCVALYHASLSKLGVSHENMTK